MTSGKELINRMQKVGEGGFGIVYIGSYREHKEVGIKDVKGKLSDEALTEAKILKKLTHPNIIQYIDIVQLQNQTSIIMEFVDGGSLYDYIKRTAQSSSYWKATRQIMIDVAHGMSYLHGERVVHADLKSLNVLLRHNYTAVICDFGLAKTIVDSKAVFTNQVSGTERWFAPELCFERPERTSIPSDIWAFGCILLEIISQKLPWEDAYPNNRFLLNALSKLESATIFENICLGLRAPEKLRTILCHCCAWQKNERPKFSIIVRDLSAISEIDLQNINQGEGISVPLSNSANEKPSASNKRSAPKASASLPASKDDFDEYKPIADCTLSCSADKPKKERKTSAKPRKDDSDQFKTVMDAMAAVNVEKPKPPRKSSAKPQTDDSKNQSTNEESTKYDPETGRQLFKGPRGAWYYMGSTGNKVYIKTDPV